MDSRIVQSMVTTPVHMVEIDTAATVSEYSLSYICNSKDLTDHFHHCIKVAVSLDHYFDCLVDGVVISHLKGIIIREGIPHSFLTPEANILLNYIKVDTVHSNQLLKLLKDVPWLNINRVLINFDSSQIFPAQYKDMSNNELIPLVYKFLDSVCFVIQEKKVRGDARVQSALKLIDQNLQNDLVIEQVAEQIHLSADRTRHIFVQEVGIPMAQYILWKRIRNTIKLAAQPEESFINACLKSGFGDQSHFNRAFRRIFFLRPLPIIRNCRVII